jgi:hypothetical protein
VIKILKNKGFGCAPKVGNSKANLLKGFGCISKARNSLKPVWKRF